MRRPNCHKCKYSKRIIGHFHLRCQRPKEPKVVGSTHGKLIPPAKMNFPLNFDPSWLDECNGFEEK